MSTGFVRFLNNRLTESEATTTGIDERTTEHTNVCMQIQKNLLQSASTDEERKNLSSFMHAACYVRSSEEQPRDLSQELTLWITSLWDTGALHSSYVTQKELKQHPLACIEDIEVACTLGDTKTVVQITKRAWLTVTFRLAKLELTFTEWFLVLPIDNGPGIIVGLPTILTHASTFFLEMVKAGVKAARFNQSNPSPADIATNLQTQHVYDSTTHEPTTAPTQYRSMSNIEYYYDGSGQPVVHDTDVDSQEPPAFPTTFETHLSVLNQRNSQLYTITNPGPHPDNLVPSDAISDTEARPMVTDATLIRNSTEKDLQPFLAADPEHLHRPWSQMDDAGPEDRDSDSPGLYTHVLYNMEDVASEKLAYLKALQPPTPSPTGEPSKRHICDLMRAVPGFMEYMIDKAVTTFVPHNWEGIRCTPVDFLWKPDMPTVHSSKHRPINPHRFDLVQTEFKRLCKYHLTDCRSPITSPITDADKAGPPYVRLCGDYRWINTQILHENAYIPNVKNELIKLAIHKVFIDLDMTNSFHQFLLSLETSLKLALSTPWGIYRPKFMPEGVSPASGVLQQTMSDIFSDFPWATIIFDNFCIGADNHIQLFERFKLFIDRCQEFNIHLKFSKSFFGFTQIKFFGYKVTGEGWSMDVDRIEVLNSTPFPDAPTSLLKRKQMMSFLGFALYFHEHVPGYSTLAAPFYDMCKADFNWDPASWTPPYLQLFQVFKTSLAHSLTLYFPDYSLPWILQTDASQLGCGAILFQLRLNAEGKESREPIGCYSHKFSGPATRWAVIKQEGFAIYAAVKHFEYYLRHKTFVIETDHSNLLYIEKSSMAIVQRWRLYLQSFPIIAVRHIPGKLNNAADHLSRIFPKDPIILGTMRNLNLRYYDSPHWSSSTVHRQAEEFVNKGASKSTSQDSLGDGPIVEDARSDDDNDTISTSSSTAMPPYRAPVLMDEFVIDLRSPDAQPQQTLVRMLAPPDANSTTLIHPENWPFRLPMLDRNCFLAPLSIYWCINDGDSQQVNRCLQSYIEIAAGQPIVKAIGDYITPQQVAALESPHNRYLIDVGRRILNCAPYAVTAPPTCFFSMANSAAGLIQPSTMRVLTHLDNNADARIIRQDGSMYVVLYAISHIPAYTDIMWDYRIDRFSSDSEDSDPDDSQSIDNLIDDSTMSQQDNAISSLEATVQHSLPHPSVQPVHFPAVRSARTTQESTTTASNALTTFAAQTATIIPRRSIRSSSSSSSCGLIK